MKRFRRAIKWFLIYVVGSGTVGLVLAFVLGQKGSQAGVTVGSLLKLGFLLWIVSLIVDALRKKGKSDG